MIHFIAAKTYDGGFIGDWLQLIVQDFKTAGIASPSPDIFLRAVELLAGGNVQEYLESCPELLSIFDRAREGLAGDLDVQAVKRKLKLHCRSLRRLREIRRNQDDSDMTKKGDIKAGLRGCQGVAVMKAGAEKLNSE